MSKAAKNRPKLHDFEYKLATGAQQQPSFRFLGGLESVAGTAGIHASLAPSLPVVKEGGMPANRWQECWKGFSEIQRLAVDEART